MSIEDRKRCNTAAEYKIKKSLSKMKRVEEIERGEENKAGQGEHDADKLQRQNSMHSFSSKKLRR